MYAFDANPKLAARQTSILEAFPKLSSAFTLEHAAFADFEGMGQFVGEGEHGHLAHIGPAGDANADNVPLSAVPVMTVDSLVEREGLLSIDILKSDCEGASDSEQQP